MKNLGPLILASPTPVSVMSFVPACAPHVAGELQSDEASPPRPVWDTTEQEPPYLLQSYISTDQFSALSVPWIWNPTTINGTALEGETFSLASNDPQDDIGIWATAQGASGSIIMTARVPQPGAAPQPGYSSELERYMFKSLFNELSRLRSEVLHRRISRMRRVRSELLELFNQRRENDDVEWSSRFQEQVFNLLERYGDEAVRATSAMLLGDRASPQFAHLLLRALAKSEDAETLIARRNVVTAALESKDPGLRYVAAAGLGDLGDPVSLDALRRRLSREPNRSVRRIIEAELR